MIGGQEMKHSVIGLIVVVIGVCGNAFANESNNALLEKSEVRRLLFWTEHMEKAGRDCVVTEDFFMGLDRDEAAYWSVNCNGSRANGLIVQIQKKVGAKTRIMECAIGDAIGVSCFKKMD